MKRNFEVNPKDGWVYANANEMQKESANIIGNKHCMNPQIIYEKFTELDIYLPSIMHHLMTNDILTKANNILFALLLNNDEKPLFNQIGNNYEKYSQTK